MSRPGDALLVGFFERKWRGTSDENDNLAGWLRQEPGRRELLSRLSGQAP